MHCHDHLSLVIFLWCSLVSAGNDYLIVLQHKCQFLESSESICHIRNKVTKIVSPTKSGIEGQVQVASGLRGVFPF